MLTLGPEDDGRQLDLHPKDEFELHLPEVRTAGYRWSLEHADPSIALVDDNSQSPAGAHGGSGSHHFHFRVTHAGAGEVTLHYGRAWEKQKGPAKTFTLKVRVQP